MPTFTKEVYVDVDLDEFDDDELVEELEDRGYHVSKAIEPSTPTDLEHISWLLTLDKKRDALILLERMLPELKGISDKFN